MVDEIAQGLLAGSKEEELEENPGEIPRKSWQGVER